MTTYDVTRALRGAGLALTVCGLGLFLSGCEALNEKPSHSAGWTLLDPSQRHPIMVQQQPHTMNLKVARGQNGLSASQRAKLYNFVEKFKATDSGNSKLVISVPAGSANETASMHAVSDIRPMLADRGFTDQSVSIEPYAADGDHQAAIRISYLRFHAEGPECGRWPENLAETPRNNNYHNFGCAQQRNLAAQIANPADLLGPRTMTAGSGARNDVVFEKYTKGEDTAAVRGPNQRAERRER